MTAPRFAPLDVMRLRDYADDALCEDRRIASEWLRSLADRIEQSLAVEKAAPDSVERKSLQGVGLKQRSDVADSPSLASPMTESPRAYKRDEEQDRFFRQANPAPPPPSPEAEPESEFEKALDGALNRAYSDGLRDHSYTQSAATIEAKREVVRLYREALAAIGRQYDKNAAYISEIASLQNQLGEAVARAEQAEADNIRPREAPERHVQAPTDPMEFGRALRQRTIINPISAHPEPITSVPGVR